MPGEGGRPRGRTVSANAHGKCKMQIFFWTHTRTDEDTGAVAGIRLTTAGAAVRHADEHVERVGDDAARLGPVELANEPNPA